VRGVQLLFLLYGAALATVAPFVSVMLQARGLTPAAVGLVGAVSALGFTLAVPVWGHVADLVLGRVRALQVATLGAGVSLAFFGLPVPAAALGGMVVVYNVFQSALPALADALAVGVLADRPQDYGRIRVLSSLSYGVVVIAIGFLYDRTGYEPVPMIWLAACLLMAGGLSLVREPAVHRPTRPRRRGGSTRMAFAAEPRLPLVLAVVGLLFVAILGAFTFLNLHLVTLGGTPSDIALAGGLAALAEIPATLVATRVARAIGLRGLFVVSALAYSACIASWVVIHEPELIIVSRAASGPAFAGIWVACVLTINVLLPQNLQATGQALYQTTAFGLGAMIANAAGGLIYQEAGPSTLFALAAAIGVVASVAAWLVLPRSGELRRTSHEGASTGDEPRLDQPAPEPVTP
jgi:MFS transporter, PPP family, 3-phenylpropionic acid transporter